MKKIFDLCNPAVPVDWSICIDQEVHKQWIDWKEILLCVFHRKMMFVHSDWVVATTQNNKDLFLALQVYSNGIKEDGKYWIYRGYHLMTLYSLWFFPFFVSILISNWKCKVSIGAEIITRRFTAYVMGPVRLIFNKKI